MFAKLFGKGDNETATLPETDLHSHLIPGIDDGAKTMEEAIKLILGLKALGYKKLITTPHIMSHRFPNSAETILRGLDALRRELERRDIDIAVEAAAEYYVDEHFLELLERGEILTFGTDYLLFELSYIAAPANLEALLFTLQSRGYRPVLAHPERYTYLQGRFDRYVALKEAGALFQLNGVSLAGHYANKTVQTTARKLSERGMIDFVGSDTHGMRHIDSLRRGLETDVFQSLFRHNNILNAQL
jgi:tyrosine-protein phosphatase YwqE